MPSLDELRLMAKVARLYYIENHNQSTIARRLNLSQATISRLLKKSQENGIVRITVNPPAGVYSDLESALVALYHLDDVIIADGPDEASLLKNIGSAAAHYIETTIKKGEMIGISSWSETLLAMVDALHPLSKPIDAMVVQILGGIGNPSAEVYAARLTERLANLIQGSVVFLPAPGITTSLEAKEHLLQEPYVSHAVELFDNVTLALVGIGAIKPSNLLASSGNVFSQDELNQLKSLGAVGDICLRFFDADGNPVKTALDDRVIGIELNQLKRTTRTVGVAGGARKIAAIKGALKGGFINVLVTDHATAQALIQA